MNKKISETNRLTDPQRENCRRPFPSLHCQTDCPLRLHRCHLLMRKTRSSAVCGTPAASNLSRTNAQSSILLKSCFGTTLMGFNSADEQAYILCHIRGSSSTLAPLRMGPVMTVAIFDHSTVATLCSNSYTGSSCLNSVIGT
jgi:hypothetical protein